MKGILVYIHIGHGFRSPAVAIQKELEKLDHEIVLLDLFKEFRFKGIDRIAKRGWEFCLKHPLFFDMIFHSFNNKQSISYTEKLLYNRTKDKLLSYLLKEKPDFILSFHPNTSNLIAKLIHKYKLPIAMFSYNSDVILSHLAYISKHTDRYFVSTKQGYDSMKKQGQKNLVLTSFPLDQKFKKRFSSKKKERKKLGLKDEFTLLIMAGSNALGINKTLIKEILNKCDFQVAMICGKNNNLKKEMRNLAKTNSKLVVRGFVDNMQDYIYCSDLVSGKSGLNFVFETIYLKKPFIVLKAMANEKYAARLITKNKIGWWPKNNTEFVNLLKILSKNKKILSDAKKNIKKLGFKFNTKDIASYISENAPKIKDKKIKNKKILFFDLGGTLCNIPIHDKWHKVNLEGTKKALQKINLDDDKIAQLASEFVLIKSNLRKQSKKTLNEKEIKKQFEKFLKSKHINVKNSAFGDLEEEFISTELNICQLFQGTKNTLNKLSEKYDMYILSNNVSLLLVEKILDKFSIRKYFKKIYVSANIGVRKPHPDFISHVLSDIKANPLDCIMIGDRLGQDVKMANSLGISSIFVSITDHPDNKIRNINYDFKVNSINELKKLLSD